MSATPSGSVRRMLDRDGHKCVACGTGFDLTPQHRANRGLSLIHISEPTRPY